MLENSERKNWQFIVWPLIIIFGIAFGGAGIWHLDQMDFFEPVYSASDFLQDQINKITPPAIIQNEDEKELIFINHQKKIVKKMPLARLNLDEIFHIPSDIKNWNSIHVVDIIEAPKNIFYFLVATTYTCGANNCSHALFKFDAQNDQLMNIRSDIFGGGVRLIPSPDNKKLAIVSHHHGSVCDENGYIDILDTESFEHYTANSFQRAGYPTTYINRLSWQNTSEIELETFHTNCAILSKPSWRRLSFYNIYSQEIKVQSEEILPDS